MRNTLIAILILFSALAFGQRLDNNTWGNQPSFVQAYGYVGGSSTAFTTKFFNQLFRSDTLQNDQLDNQWKKLSETNFLGLDYESGIRLKFDVSKKGAVLFKVSDNIHVDAQIDKNLFGLALYGNWQFAGDTLTMSPSHFNYMRFQQIGFGYAFKPNKDFEGYVMISAINANRALNGGLYRGEVFTNSFGDTLYADVFASGLRSGNKLANGGGAAVSLGMSTKVYFAGQSWKTEVAIENLGMVQWDLDTKTFELDTQLLYTGVYVNDINGNIEKEVKRQFLDSIAAGFDGLIRNNWRNSVLPGYAQLSFSNITKSGVVSAFGAMARRNSVYKPFAWFNGGYKWKGGFDTRVEVGYGGYRKLQVGCSANFETDDLRFNFRLSNLESILPMVNGFGLTSFVGLQYIFGR